MKFLDLNGLSQLVTFGNNSYVSSVIYDSTNHVINFKNANGSVISSIDASNFIKDGMVSSVTIGTPETGPNVGKSCLIVTFNTHSGKDPIEIPIENIFSSENYYTKTEIDSQLNDKQDTLVSGTNIKTINNQSLVGSGNINITADGCEVVSNKVTSLSSSSTDTQYPSAKAVYDALDEKYSKPSGGIPKTDLASAVQTSLDKADTALQSYTETDPVFSASDAAGISSGDITNWNNKVSNVQSDWNATSGLAQILNKPTIPAAVTESTVSGWGFTKNAGTITGVGSVTSGSVTVDSTPTTNSTNLVTSGGVESALSGYLPLTGGTMTGDILQKMTADTSNYRPAFQWVNTSGVRIAEIGYMNTSQAVIINPQGSADAWSDQAGKYSLKILPNNNGLTFNTNKVWHAGNDGSDSGLDADLLDGLDSASYLHKLSQNIDANSNSYGVWSAVNAPSSSVHYPSSYGTLLAIQGDYTNYKGQLFIRPDTAQLSVRGGSGDDWWDWKTVAFTDSNVASATKLQTARSIWGQSFDGSADISGAMTGVTSIDALLNFDATNGRLGVGTDSPYAKLEINSTLSALDATNVASSAMLALNQHNNDGLFFGYASPGDYGWIQAAYFGTSANPSEQHTYQLSLNPLGGNVGIGTVTAAYKLDVAGDARAAGKVYIGTSGGYLEVVNVGTTASPVYALKSSLPLTGGTITGTTTLTYGTNLEFVDSNGENHSLRAFASWPDSLAHYTPGNGWTRIWDSGNDGSGSGLDADLLDGQHGSYYAAASSIPTKVSQLTNDSDFITGITSSMVSTALGYTPANSASLSGYLPLTGGTLTGLLRISSGNDSKIILDNTDNETNYQQIVFSQNGTEYARLGTFNDTVLKWQIGDNSYKIWHAGNDGSGSGLDADLLDGKHNGELSAISCVNLGTYGVEGSTVADCKAWLAQMFSDSALGVGYNCNVGTSYIEGWDNDSSTYTPSSVYSFIKIGGGYSGKTYGQWLLSSYGTARIGYVGRSGDQWTDIKWIATTEDIPTSLPASDVYSWAKASSKPSYSWSEITGKPSVAIQGDVNNFVHSGNEVTFVPSGYTGAVYLNYRTVGGTNGNITEYILGNGGGGALGTAIHTGNFQSQALSKSQVTTALGYTPPTSDTNTTYAAGTGVTISGSNNAINVTYGTAANTACQGNDSRLSNARPASDVYAWAKASSKPSYDNSEIGLTTITATGGSSLTLTGGKIYRLINLTGSFQFILDVTDVRCEDNVCASKQYHCIFSTGSTAPTINWPAIDIWYGGSAPVIEANKTYEFDIICNATDVVAICVEVA